MVRHAQSSGELSLVPLMLWSVEAVVFRVYTAWWWAQQRSGARSACPSTGLALRHIVAICSIAAPCLQ